MKTDDRFTKEFSELIKNMTNEEFEKFAVDKLKKITLELQRMLVFEVPYEKKKKKQYATSVTGDTYEI